MSWFSSSTTVKVDPDLLLEKASEIDEFASSAGDIYDQMLNLFLALKESVFTQKKTASDIIRFV